jgi:hypothetical protein
MLSCIFLFHASGSKERCHTAYTTAAHTPNYPHRTNKPVFLRITIQSICQFPSVAAVVAQTACF